jgi:hypothetical protein
VQGAEATLSLVQLVLSVRPLQDAAVQFVLEKALEQGEGRRAANLRAATQKQAGSLDSETHVSVGDLLIQQLAVLVTTGCSDACSDVLLEAFGSATSATQAVMAAVLGELVPDDHADQVASALLEAVAQDSALALPVARGLQGLALDANQRAKAVVALCPALDSAPASDVASLAVFLLSTCPAGSEAVRTVNVRHQLSEASCSAVPAESGASCVQWVVRGAQHRRCLI